MPLTGHRQRLHWPLARVGRQPAEVLSVSSLCVAQPPMRDNAGKIRLPNSEDRLAEYAEIQAVKFPGCEPAPAVTELFSGAGDGNQKYRWRALASWNQEVACAKSAACDFCVKDAATRANASQCCHGTRTVYDTSILCLSGATGGYSRPAQSCRRSDHRSNRSSSRQCVLRLSHGRRLLLQ
jgi:hypothetical protein